MEEEGEFPELPELINNVLLSNRRLQLMFADFIDYFHLIDNQLPTTIFNIEIDTIIERAIVDVAPTANQNRITIHHRLSENIPRALG